jgi:hypothetical protein
MAASINWYGLAFSKILNKEVDWTADTIMVSLHHNLTPNQDTYDYWDDVVATEIAAGSGYAHEGMALPTPTIAYDAGTNVVKLDGDDCTWTSATIHATHAVIYDKTPGTDATNPVLAYVDFGGDMDSTNGDFKITWNAGGILTITPA